MRGKDKRFKQMFKSSRNVFNSLLHELAPFLDDGKPRNHRQNVPAILQLGVALYFFAKFVELSVASVVRKTALALLSFSE
jgi:hypothetical protein